MLLAAGATDRKAPFVWNEFGGTIGGPIVIPHIYNGRDRTFFFAGYDGSRLRLGTTLNGVAPTPSQIAAATSLVQSQSITPKQLGLNILQQYASLGLSGPFAVDNRGRQTPNSGVLKIDHSFSTVDSLSARYLHTKHGSGVCLDISRLSRADQNGSWRNHIAVLPPVESRRLDAASWRQRSCC